MPTPHRVWRFNFHVIVFEELSVKIPDPVIEGSEVKLSCSAPCGLEDDATVIWRKNGEELPGEQTSNIDLVIENIRTEDEGYYSCALQHGTHSSEAVELNVKCKQKKQPL